MSGLAQIKVGIEYRMDILQNPPILHERLMNLHPVDGFPLNFVKVKECGRK